MMDLFEKYSSCGIIEPRELMTLLETYPDRIKLADGTYVGGGPASALELFTAKRIGNAVHFDIDEIADQRADMAHMVPSPAVFGDHAGKLGIVPEDFVVVYDQFGISMAASRVWWMFRLFGHENVVVLNGGLPCWEVHGGTVHGGVREAPTPVKYKAAFRPGLVSSLEDVREATGAGSAIVDARTAERFSGRAEEFRPGLRSGHIPGSINIPFMSLINPEDGRLEDKSELSRFLDPITPAGQIITTCGSGVTACVLALAFYNIGRKDVSVYDGSWTEWGREDKGTPVALL